MAQKNKVELWLEETAGHGLPVPGLEVEAGRTAVLITDPQNDFLHEEGVAWGVVGESARENNTIENLVNLMGTAVSTGMPLIISPHYYYPTDYGWTLKGGTLEKLMHDIHMYNRKGSLTLEGFENSGADWLDAFKPFINHEKTVVCSPHKIFGPQNNDVVLQLQKLKIEKVILAGMSANLCVESHLRELLERGFDVAVAADATAAAKVPGLDGMAAALTNYRMLASDVWNTADTVEKMRAAAQ